MTLDEYKDFVRRVEGFFRREGINNLSMDIYESEGCFSWTPCDCCGRPLGGYRYRASGYNPETQEIHEYEVCEYEVCQDCLYYAAYGMLDDMTMMDIDSDEYRDWIESRREV